MKRKTTILAFIAVAIAGIIAFLKKIGKSNQ